VNALVHFMAMKRLAKRTRTTFNRLTRQRRTSLLDTLLKIVIVGYVILWLFLEIPTGFQLTWDIRLPVFIGITFISVCYVLNRYKFTVPATLLFLTCYVFFVLYYIAGREDATFLADLRGVPALLTMPILVAGVILGPFYAGVFSSVSIAGVLIIGILRARPGLAYLETPLDVVFQSATTMAVLITMAVLSWVFERNNSYLLLQLLSRNHELDAAGREIAKRRELEVQLNQQVDALTGQVSGAFEDQSRTTSLQLEALLRVNSTIEQLSQTSEAINRAATEVNQTAQRALQVVADGNVTLRNGLDALVRLGEQAQEVATAMQNLYRQAQQIDQILEVITELSEETNLLALNAKIEAAGAGEFGRRFASVANEVQRLANRSKDSVSQVRSVIEEIQFAIETSASAAEKGTLEATQALSGARSIELTFEGIVIMVENNAMLASQITGSIQEQRTATIQVVENMRQISSISNTVAEGSQDVLQNLHQLKDAVYRLNVASSSIRTSSRNGKKDT
jgi:methyl-accepting chemotaxis protein